jgi:predicted secreted protein
MTLISWIAVYFVLWWICLFAVLPIGAHSQTDAGEVVRGTDPGAPAVFKAWPKLHGTSVLAGVVLVLLMWGLSNPALQQYMAVQR